MPLVPMSPRRICSFNINCLLNHIIVETHFTVDLNIKLHVKLMYLYLYTKIIFDRFISRLSN